MKKRPCVSNRQKSLNIDRKLFLKQRNTLNKVLLSKELTKKEYDHLTGLQNLLDALYDNLG